MPTKIETSVIKPQIKFENDSQELTYLDNEVEILLNEKIREIRNYIIENHGKGKSNSEKDNLYFEAQKLWKSFIDSLEVTKYNFYLNQDQWKFITDLILNKLEYDVNTVFFAIELKDLLDEMKSKTNSKMSCVKVTATQVTYIYHLIQKHKVKGLNKESFLFSQILVVIANISKIFNYYDTTGKNLSAEVQDWVVTFEEGVNFENREEPHSI
jgi:hypothetical protein